MNKVFVTFAIESIFSLIIRFFIDADTQDIKL